MEKVDWSQPVPVDDVTLVFPASVIGRYLPPMADIPEDFQRHNNEWVKKASALFFGGGNVDLKPEIDRPSAIRQLKTCLSSFQPKHEHKEYGVGYLLSLWCNSPE